MKGSECARVSAADSHRRVTRIESEEGTHPRERGHRCEGSQTTLFNSLLGSRDAAGRRCARDERAASGCIPLVLYREWTTQSRRVATAGVSKRQFWRRWSRAGGNGPGKQFSGAASCEGTHPNAIGAQQCRYRTHGGVTQRRSEVERFKYQRELDANGRARKRKSVDGRRVPRENACSLCRIRITVSISSPRPMVGEKVRHKESAGAIGPLQRQAAESGCEIPVMRESRSGPGRAVAALRITERRTRHV